MVEGGGVGGGDDEGAGAAGDVEGLGVELKAQEEGGAQEELKIGTFFARNICETDGLTSIPPRMNAAATSWSTYEGSALSTLRSTLTTARRASLAGAGKSTAPRRPPSSPPPESLSETEAEAESKMRHRASAATQARRRANTATGAGRR